MKASDAISSILNEIQKIDTKTNSTIAVAGLEKYLIDLKKILSSDESQSIFEMEKNSEMARRDWDITIEKHKFRGAESLEMFKAVIEAGQTTVKTALVINGGACLALLTFVGNLMVKANVASKLNLADFGQALLLFLIGVGVAGFTSALRYLAQAVYAHQLMLVNNNSEKSPTWKTWGNFLRNITAISCVASYGLFFWGGVVTYLCISSYK